MRDIKFRAWHKEYKLMTQSFNLTNNCRLEGTHLDVHNYGDGWGWEQWNYWYLEDIEIMQYTGLKDKNSTEIYEGDIVELAENTYGETELPISCVVKWNDRGFYQLWRNGLIHWKFWREDTYHNTWYRKNWKVIGNIHQNKGLLKEK